MNKIGAKDNNILVWIVVAAIALAAFGVIDVSGIFGNKNLPTPDTDSKDCETAPSLAFSTVNALQKGSAVTTVQGIRLNGVLLNGVPSALQKGDVVEIFNNASNYISTILPTHTMTCGKNTLTAEVYATDDPTVRVFNTDANRINDNVLDSCVINGGTNQTSSSSSVSMKVEIQSASLQSSGDMVMVVEYDNSTEVGMDGITLSGTDVSAGQVLSTYTVNSSTSTVKAFNIPASVNGAVTSYYLNIAPKSGVSLGPAGSAGSEIYVTLYSKQAFVDTDGQFKIGIEDASGSTKYEDTSRFGFCIVGA